MGCLFRKSETGPFAGLVCSGKTLSARTQGEGVFLTERTLRNTKQAPARFAWRGQPDYNLI